MDSQDPMASLKNFTFYYKTAQQTLTLAAGTSQAEIIDTLRTVFGIPAQKKLLFLGGEGNPIILSSALPSGIKLTVLDEDYQIAKINGPTAGSSKWKWKQAEGGIIINDYSFKTNQESKTTFYGDIKITKGKHWWRIQLKEIFCCQDLGITKDALKPGFWTSKPEEYGQTIGFPGKFPGQTTGPGWTSCNNLKWLNHVFLFYVDMEAKRFIIINQNLERLINDIKIVFDTAVPFFHSNKHDNMVTLLSVGEGQLENKWMNLIPKQ